MKDQHDLARGWIAKADSDLTTTRRMVTGMGPYDTACFHAQQAIEKLLKSLLAFWGLPIPRTHDLEELQQLCMAQHLIAELGQFDLTPVTDYAVAVRYDFAFWPDQDTAREALELAAQVRDTVVQYLDDEEKRTSVEIAQ